MRCVMRQYVFNRGKRKGPFGIYVTTEDPDYPRIPIWTFPCAPLYVGGKRRSWSACATAQADLDLRCP